MKPKGSNSPGTRRFSKRQFLLAPFLAMLSVVLTGCPHNDYTLELTPKDNGVERTLIFYRVDGSNSNGVPNYQAFPTNELAAIARVYPAAAVKREGQRYVANGEFAGLLPNDVGGVGSYTNFRTSLGSAGFYSERFRGSDDLVTQTTKRFQAADQIADLAIGWTQTEFSHERNYRRLRKFLDGDFRHDLKNAGLYFWAEQLSALSDTNAIEEFAVRFGQYLYERGYLKLSDVPELYLAVEDNNGSVMLNLVQRLMAEKMGIPASGPLPKSFAVLNDPAALERSWTNYLVRSDPYRAKVKEWKKQAKNDPKLRRPEPSDVLGDLFENLSEPVEIFGGEADHLTVKLMLNHVPNHSNGKWSDGQVVWTAHLEKNRPLPVLCYASWSNPNAEFQKQHFGSVILDGDGLSEYCLWQSSLNKKRVKEWESFVAGLQPGNKLRERLKAFQFTVRPAETNQWEFGRKLLMDALPKEAEVNPNSK